MTEERAKHLAELVAKVSYHNFRNYENIKIEMSKTSDKISSWKLTNISDEICSQSWRHAEHWGRHDEEVHCCHQVCNDNFSMNCDCFQNLQFFRNQKEGQPGSWTTYGNVKVFRQMTTYSSLFSLWDASERYLSVSICVFVNSPQINMEDPGFIELMKEYYTVLVRQKNLAKAIYDRSLSRIIWNLYFKQNQW